MSASKNKRKNGKRKAHVAHERARDFFNHKMRIWTWESERVNDVNAAYAEKHMGSFWRPVGMPVAQRVVNERQHWSVCIRALCYSGKGGPWVEEVTITPDAELALQDLEGIYERYKGEVLAACQSRHVYDCGWLAQTFKSKNPADNDKWPMIKMGAVTEQRKAAWQAVRDADKQEERKAA